MRTKSHRPWLLFLLTLTLTFCFTSASAQTISTYSGTFADGATYLIDVPPNWNGTLLLYSHGYVVPGSTNPALDVGDPATGAFLLSQGFALAGSSYATTGWAVHEALPDQIAVLDTFKSLVGKPSRTIAWGHSLGGMITAGLVQRYPRRFDGAMPMCGVLSGGVGTWNEALDGAFAFYNLVGFGSGLQVVDITDPITNLTIAETVLAIAQSTPQGQARIALSAALADIPGWFNETSPEPARTDYTTREANQFLWFQQVDFPFSYAFRAELEARAGGNPSWNTGVDYRRQLERSIDRDEVRALYRQAGLSLDADLDTLNHASRISANPASVQYLAHNIIYNGRISIPVLTLHTVGDGLVVYENEHAYADVVREEDNARLLRQTYVSRAGHCAFTPAEQIAGLESLISRLDSGHWGSTSAHTLNHAAAALGPDLNILFLGSGTVAPAFVNTEPPQFLRPFDAVDHGH
jgi:pimeloyl-ACP methyl ester carboxylesterase